MLRTAATLAALTAAAAAPNATTTTTTKTRTARRDNALPNVVFCLVDDLGWNTVYNNKDIKSPVINKLAAEGVKLTSFYAYRYCSPTRASFLTGRTPMFLINNRGNMNGPDASLSTDPSFTMLPKRLKEAGYYTYQVGKWHQGENARAWTPVGRGFDESFGFLGGGEDHYSQTSGNCHVTKNGSSVGFSKTDYWQETAGGAFNGGAIADCSDAEMSTTWPCPMAELDVKIDGNASDVAARCKAGKYANCVERGTAGSGPAHGCYQCKKKRYTGFDFTASAVESITSHKAKHAGAPLFMYLSLHNTHMPCEAPPEFTSQYNFSDQSHGNRRNVFDGMVSTVESTVKNVTAALKKANMWKTTLFVWACDNGSPINAGGAGSNAPLRGSKGTSFEGGTRVPAFLSGGLPALAPMAGKKLGGIVAIADFYVTILSLAGLKAQDSNPKTVTLVDGLDQWAYFSGSAAASARNEYVYEHLRYNETTYGQNITACTYNGHLQVEPCFGAGVIRVGDWKLVHATMGDSGHYGHFSPNASWPGSCAGELCQLCSASSPCLFNVGTGNDEAEHHNVAAFNPAIVKRLLAALRKYDNKFHPSSEPAPDEAKQMCEEALKNGGWVTPFKTSDDAARVLKTAVTLAAMTAAVALPTPEMPLTYSKVSVSPGITYDVAMTPPAANKLLLVHGWPECSWFWRGVVDPLVTALGGPEKLQLIMPDMRGFNNSAKPEAIGAYNVSHIVDDLVGLVKQQGGGKVHVLGHDWGGPIAWLFASRHPELTKTLTILNGPHPSIFIDLLRHDKLQQNRSSYMIGFDTAAANSLDPSTLFASDSWFDAATAAAYKAAYPPAARQYGLNWYRANVWAGRMNVKAFSANMPSTLPAGVKIAVPTLVLWGMADAAFDNEQNLRLLPPFVPDLKIIRYANVSHWVAQEVPGRVAADWAAFVKGKGAVV